MSPLLVRIFDVDFYLSAPVANLDVTFSQFRGSTTHQVPVIRVFGSTDDGKKICVHIHGVFPYFYIPYDGTEPASGLMYKIASNLDKAINISLGQASSNNQHIYKIVLVSGIPFYGYHSKKHQFFKVYLYNPMLIKRVNNLLFNETVLGNIYQPHETHLNFTLQFMIDYNLHGMSNIILSQVKFRQENGLKETGVFSEETLSKVSSCELECDTLGEYILNRQEIDSGNLAANPGIAALWEDEKQRRRNKNEDSQLPHYLSLSKTNVPPTESHELFKRALRERLAMLTQDPDKSDFNLSVYPAECPRNKSLLNCSMVDFHSPCNSQSDMSYDSELDQTLMNDTLNLTVDEDVQDLLNVLKDLEKNVDVEEDSILSQVSRNEVDIDDENDVDMSVAIETGDDLLDQTINFSQLFESSENNGDIPNSTLRAAVENEKKVPNIPQLDGNCQEVEVQNSVDNIPHAKDDAGDMFIELKMEKSRKCSTININTETIVHTEENNNFSLDCVVTLPNVAHSVSKEKESNKILISNKENTELSADKSIVFQINILKEDTTTEKYSLESYSDCELNHKFAHVEKLMDMRLCKPNLIEIRKSNHNLIKSEINREHPYFSADTIGERVHSKNSKKRKKLILKNYLEYPCELVVVPSNIHFPHIIRKKRDMPSLNGDSSETEYPIPESALCRWKQIRKCVQNNESNKRKEVVKKSIIRHRFSGRKEVIQRNVCKRKLLVQKFCKEYKKTWNKLENGAKPTFRVIPGYRPYVFEPIHKVVSIQTVEKSRSCIQFSSTIIPNGIISSNTTNDKKTANSNGGYNLRSRQSKKESSTVTKNTGQKTFKAPNKIIDSTINNTLSKKKKKSSLSICSKKTEKIKETIKRTKIQEIEQGDIAENEKLIEANTIKSPAKTAPILRSIEEVFKAQKQNEAHFFNSVFSLMDHCAINENKILDSSNSHTDSVRRDILFLDGPNDNSDEEISNKQQGRSNRKARAVYSSLPIFTASRSSGRSTPIGEQTDSKKKNEKSTPLEPKISDNMKKIKRRINFDSSSQKDNKKEEKQHTKTLKQLKTENHNKKSNFNSINIEPNTDSCENVCNNIKKDLDHFENTDKINEDCEKVNNFNIKEEKTDDSHHIESEHTNLNKEDSHVSYKEKHIQAPQDTSYIAQDDCDLSTSELYDIINNYNPQEGSSNWSKKLEDEFEDFSSADHEKFENSPSIKASMESLEKVDDIPIHSSGSTSDMFSNEKEVRDVQIPSSNNSVYYKPLYKPPTRSDVIQNLSEYGIPRIRSEEPFYSKAEDASGSMEVGYNLLKIKTLTSLDAQDFDSSFEGLEHYRKKYFPQDSRGGKKENPRYLYCPEGTCLLAPLKKPPTRKEVEKWLKENSVPKKIVEKSKITKSKIYFASSQDIYSDNDMSMDLSLTLSPSTPKTDITLTNTSDSNVDSKVLDSRETCFDSDASTPNSNRSSPVFNSSRRTRISVISETPESNTESDTSVIEESFNADLTLTPRSTRSGKSSPVLPKTRRRRKLDRSITLRKSALLSHSSEHSGIISGVSLNNTYGFKCSVQNYQEARASVKYEHLTILSMELHVNTRSDLNPNPEYDQVQAIFYSISNDVEENTVKPRRCEGVFAVDASDETSKSKCSFLDGTGIPYDVKYVKNELELFEEFTKFVIYWDPDILLGYEIQMLSWGYLIERCFHLGINIIPEISRVKDKHLKFNEKETGDLRVTGRVVLDLWRLLRHEIALQSYTLQSTVYEILQRRIPKYSFQDLTTWWSHQSSLYRHRTVEYYMTCVRCQLKVLEQLDFVGRTSELARLFGIQFYEVLSRGSQFRVESMMLRLAKPLNYVAVSPSVQQRAKMKAPEYIALVLEPESKLYTDPVIVLDFQSLYPSIIIAYNYCFSTCAGRVESLGKNTPFEFGAANLRVSKERIKYLLKRNLLNFSPCGVAFVKKSVRDGIMPRMLREILDTRLMVKKSMKENKEDAVLQKVLHSRQLGLKLIANVTYGYTAANFSGRMPSVELGDSIVSKARETLQRTISLVDNNKEWGVRVVYGDTDSLFVHCPGKSRAEAFAIGEQIVEAVGKENPDPVKLKLEKVYQPCILQTKKRYVGYMYESPEQKEPSYDAKGIETVRRDGCPAVAKMLERTLRILFETKDVSKVKEYCLKQFNKIILGRLSIKDLTFAKEFRGFTGYRPGACVPSLELAKRWVAVDKRAEPRRGERVPYIIINGPPGLPLIRSVRSPHELLKDPALRPNALYYITRVIIPPLNRCFNLIGADLHHWFLQMPRKQLHYLPTSTSPTKRSTISQYFVSTLCAICGIQTQNGLCDVCRGKPQETVTILNERARHWESSYNNCKLICSSCTQILDNPGCISLDCPVLYRLNQTSRDLQQADHIRHLLSQYFDIF